jgi:hypothetical protein
MGISLPLLFAVLTLGYGIPGEGDSDPSAIGTFAYRICKANRKCADNCARGIVGFLMSLATVGLAWFSLFSWLVALTILTFGYPLIVRKIE